MRSPMLRGSGFLAAAALVLVGMDMAEPGILAFLCATVGVSFLFGIAVNVVRDRLEGGLEFLTSLPVTSRVAARARLAACSVVAVPSAVLLTVAWMLVAPAAPEGFPTAVWVVSCFLGTWLSGTGSSALLLGVLLRFSQEMMGRIPVVVVVTVFVGAGALERAFPGLESHMARLASEPWFPAALSVAVLPGSVAALAVAYRLLEGGIRRFRPGRGSITW
jgi:hypothetical protein